MPSNRPTEPLRSMEVNVYSPPPRGDLNWSLKVQLPDTDQSSTLGCCAGVSRDRSAAGHRPAAVRYPSRGTGLAPFRFCYEDNERKHFCRERGAGQGCTRMRVAACVRCCTSPAGSTHRVPVCTAMKLHGKILISYLSSITGISSAI